MLNGQTVKNELEGMKVFVFILLCLVALHPKAQETHKMNVGMDFFLLNRIYENGYGKAIYSSTGVFAEKPVQLNFLKQTFLNPGLSFKSVNENFSQSALGGSFSKDLNHYTLNGYVEIIRKIEVEGIKPAVLFLGALGGAHFITWARGSAESSSVMYDQANWKNSNYRENPSGLFNKVYFGFLAGIQLTNSSWIEPSFELRWLPFYGEYKMNRVSPFEIALTLGIGRNE